ncbi:MAG: chloramphenicol acetyltransferase [Ruminococcaceae bacterium]|nr:chloramphenicol acetyltransferase [Oscillospiraceae bacterium]
MRYIDMQTNPRRAQFEYFQSFANPYASVTVPCDITPLKDRRPFFLTFLYCAIQAANAIPELRRRIVDGRVVEFDNCISSHTVALPDETYCYCELDCSMPFEEFLPYAMAKVEQAKTHPSMDDVEPERLFFVTSFPWASFTGIHLPTTQPADSNVRITFGKAYEQDGKYLLPTDLTVHHALADGVHIAKFFQKFEENCRNLR